MTTLPGEFKRGGFNHTLVERAGNVAIYERGRPGQRSHYEVVRIRERGEREFAGRVIEAGEYYPASEEWGTHGWTANTLDAARARFFTLTN